MKALALSALLVGCSSVGETSLPPQTADGASIARLAFTQILNNGLVDSSDSVVLCFPGALDAPDQFLRYLSRSELLPCSAASSVIVNSPHAYRTDWAMTQCSIERIRVNRMGTGAWVDGNCVNSVGRRSVFHTALSNHTGAWFVIE